jgi:hypothetical protein
MHENNQMGSRELTEEQNTILSLLLNQIIPPSGDGKMPGVSTVDIFNFLESENLFEWIKEGLNWIDEESHNKYEQKYSAMTIAKQSQIIARMRSMHFRFFSLLANRVIECYYQHDLVLKAIGLEPRSPFPEGYSIEDGDLTLLEPVLLRGKRYRDVT